MKLAPRCAGVVPVYKLKESFNYNNLLACIDGVDDDQLGELIGEQHECSRQKNAFLLQKRHGPVGFRGVVGIHVHASGLVRTHGHEHVEERRVALDHAGAEAVGQFHVYLIALQNFEWIHEVNGIECHFDFRARVLDGDGFAS